MYTSPRKCSSDSRVSIVTIHSPESDITAQSTREGSRAFSSRRDTLFDGDTSSSDINFEVEGENVCRDEGCDDGSINVDESVCTARGADVGAEERPYDIEGSALF